MGRGIERLLFRVFLVLAMGWAGSYLNADSLYGIPVTGVGSTATQAVPNCPGTEGQVCYNSSTGSIGFFIPLSSSKSGIYGVTNVGFGKTAGTTADIGDGTENALTMFLKFAPVTLPVSTASLSFTFTDLDLKYWNDPAKFLETVQFFSALGAPLTPVIRASGDSGTSPLVFSITGNSDSQTILFPNVTSILNDPFFIRLNFTSAWYQDGKNTPESLIATLTTTPLVTPKPPVVVPEPGALILLVSGLAFVAVARRRT